MADVRSLLPVISAHGEVVEYWDELGWRDHYSLASSLSAIQELEAIARQPLPASAGASAEWIQGSVAQDQLARQSGWCRSTGPKRHTSDDWNTARRGSAMPGTIARWIRDRYTRCPTIICLALMMGAVPVAVHADDSTKYFDIKA
jgi:hypothetical protein